MAGALSGQTTNFANLVVEQLGPASGGAGSSATSVGQIITSTLSSRLSTLVNELWASSLSFGGKQMGGVGSTGQIFSVASLIAPFVVQGSASSFTIVTWPAVAPGDAIAVFPLPGGAVSSLSSGLVPHSHCSQAGQVEFRLSNASTLQQNQSTRTWVFVATRSGITQ